MRRASSDDVEPPTILLVIPTVPTEINAMFSHLDAKNQPVMVNVGEKPVTRRTAHAIAIVTLPEALASLLKDGEIATKKGPIFHTAILAGIMGAKRTSELIPLCHPLALDDCQIQILPNVAHREVEIHCRVQTHGKTGVEMEALTGATVAALTLYDMGKAVSHGIEIKGVRLLEKTGGKSDYRVS
ncbi:MAG TPA: cyclic pyranopterin monophosphate synthase MoaC [Opitutus sp.]|nr:cyclic pyranopterin monophosphate synthase MoaC [Opitutus sp.]